MKEHELQECCAELNLPGSKLEVVDLSKGVPEPSTIRPVSKLMSTKQLHEELITREGVREIILSPEGRARIEITEPNGSAIVPITGPCRILINHD